MQFTTEHGFNICTGLPFARAPALFKHDLFFLVSFFGCCVVVLCCGYCVGRAVAVRMHAFELGELCPSVYVLGQPGPAGTEHARALEQDLPNANKNKPLCTCNPHTPPFATYLYGVAVGMKHSNYIPYLINTTPFNAMYSFEFATKITQWVLLVEN